jgi:hypothetical protein
MREVKGSLGGIVPAATANRVALDALKRDLLGGKAAKVMRPSVAEQHRKRVRRK